MVKHTGPFQPLPEKVLKKHFVLNFVFLRVKQVSATTGFNTGLVTTGKSARGAAAAAHLTNKAQAKEKVKAIKEIKRGCQRKTR